MKVLLIGPSNYSLMPYLHKYKQNLISMNVDVDTLEWDRMGLGAKSKYIYSDNKIGFSRGVLDYLKFSRFVKEVIKTGEYQKIVVFSLQSAFFLRGILKNDLKEKFILDIRDWNSILKFYNFNSIINHSKFTVLSSPGFRNFLPKNNNFFISHNIPSGFNLNKIDEFKPNLDLSNIIISSIGSFRNYPENMELLNELGNDSSFKIEYHGEGPDSIKLSSFVKNKGFSNVILSGKYNFEDEDNFYRNISFVNILEYSNIFSKFLLPNRLYKAVFFSCPVIVFGGSFLSEIIEKYNLGCVVFRGNSIKESIISYLKNFDLSTYFNGRQQFLEIVNHDELVFQEMLKTFVQEVE